jgi:hypothetical protein
MPQKISVSSEVAGFTLTAGLFFIKTECSLAFTPAYALAKVTYAPSIFHTTSSKYSFAFYHTDPETPQPTKEFYFKGVHFVPIEFPANTIKKFEIVKDSGRVLLRGLSCGNEVKVQLYPQV